MLWRATPAVLRRASRTPVVYLPGLGPHLLGRTSRQRLLQRLGVLRLAGSFEVWLVAARGPLPADTTIEALAAERAEAIRAGFGGPVDVVGASTGGSIALQLAVDHPDVVRRLVLVSAASRLGEAGRSSQREVARSLLAGRPRRAAAAMLAGTTDRPRAGLLLRLVGYCLGRSVVGRGDPDLIGLIGAEDGFDIGAVLPTISAPTLLIGGRRDGYYTPELFAATAASIPGARYLEHPFRAHLTATGRPGRRAIRAHLGSDARPPRD